MEPEIRPAGPASKAVPFARFRPDFERVQGDYRVSFARSDADLDRAFRLRYEVFNLELQEGLAESHAHGRDTDEFDAQCQHLLVEHRHTGEAVGTYRLQTSEAAAEGAGWYSSSEFDLAAVPDDILQQSAELGRACVAREHRSRQVLFLLWKGLWAFVSWNHKRYFFGCNSLTSQDAGLGMRTHRYLEERGLITRGFTVQPHDNHRCHAPAGSWEEGSVEIPTLFGIYLAYGAKVCGPPAIDRRFGTIDFLTILDVRQVDPQRLAVFAR